MKGETGMRGDKGEQGKMIKIMPSLTFLDTISCTATRTEQLRLAFLECYYRFVYCTLKESLQSLSLTFTIK